MICEMCKNEISNLEICGKIVKAGRRKYCFDCAPYKSCKSQELRSKQCKCTMEIGGENNLRKLFSESFSYAAVLRNFGLVDAGANYRMVRKMKEKYSIDVSHFTGQGHLKGKSHNWATAIPLEEVLVEDREYSSNKLRLRLLKAGIFEHKCYKCDLKEWQGFPIPLELEHKNGKHSDNRLENLTLLCPNCHAQTSSYRGKNKNKSCKPKTVCDQPKIKPEIKPKKLCASCSKEISCKAERCKSCAARRNPNKILWPTVNELHCMLKEHSYLALGKMLGVSDNAIRKRIRNHGTVDQRQESPHLNRGQ